MRHPRFARAALAAFAAAPVVATAAAQDAWPGKPIRIIAPVQPGGGVDLARKFHGLVDPVLGAARADALIASCGAVAAAPDLRALVASARP